VTKICLQQEKLFTAKHASQYLSKIKRSTLQNVISQVERKDSVTFHVAYS